jgi:hypothetical protein
MAWPRSRGQEVDNRAQKQLKFCITKMIIFETRRWAVAHGITDFAGTASWCCRFLKRHGLSMHTRTTIVQVMSAEYETKVFTV